MFQPKTFQELIDVESELPQIIAENAKYNRSPELQGRYNLSLSLLTQDEIIASIRTEMQGKVIDILPNKYGYDLLLANLPNVKHYCLWVDRERIVNQFYFPHELELKQHAIAVFGGHKLVLWQNLDSAKSVPGFEHYHILVDFE